MSDLQVGSTPSPANIFTLGAYDRFNFGDLLFPHILEEAASGALTHIATRSIDMRTVGGHVVRAVGELSSACPPSLILGGGEIVGARWSQALINLSKGPTEKALLAAYRFGGSHALDQLARKLFGTSWRFPYLPNADWSPTTLLVANSIGASSFTSMSARDQGHLAHSLSRASFISVRDDAGQHALSDAGLSSVLAPDSVAAIRGTQVGRNTPRSATGQRVATFQCSRAWGRTALGPLAESLAELARKFDQLNLLPIGLAGGHSDREVLADLKILLERASARNVNLINVAHVSDILAAIAQSDVFIGSSLHGAIVATAFEVPHVALDRVPKLDAYLDTWSKHVPRRVPAQNLVEAVRAACNASPAQLHDHATQLRHLAEANTHRVMAAAYGKSYR